MQTKGAQCPACFRSSHGFSPTEGKPRLAKGRMEALLPPLSDVANGLPAVHATRRSSYDSVTKRASTESLMKYIHCQGTVLYSGISLARRPHFGISPLCINSFQYRGRTHRHFLHSLPSLIKTFRILFLVRDRIACVVSSLLGFHSPHSPFPSVSLPPTTSTLNTGRPLLKNLPSTTYRISKHTPIRPLHRQS